MHKHQDVLAQVRAEQKAIRPNDEPITRDNLEKMTYLHQVVKEILRHRPPAIVVPHEAKTDFDIDGSLIPKGSIIMPSIMSAVNQGFTNPYEFNPDRFSEANREDVTYAKNYLVFGAGPHSCVGREYAINQLKVFTALCATSLEVDRRVTSRSEELVMGPTTFPADGCPVTFTAASVYTH
jgi:cytochrome P450 family 710 subfamily A protein